MSGFAETAASASCAADPACLLATRPNQMTAAKTNAERQREFRARKAQTEATEVRGIYAKPDDHAKIKEYAKKLAAKKQE